MEFAMGTFLQRAREAAGLTCEECAERLRIGVDDYRSMEDAPGRATLIRLCALADIFGDDGRDVMAAGILRELGCAGGMQPVDVVVTSRIARTDEVSSMLGIDERTVQRFAKDGHFGDAAFKVGGRWLFNAYALARRYKLEPGFWENGD